MSRVGLGIARAQHLCGRGVVYLLCLSTGNADGLGSIRAGELVDSCQCLGMDRSDVFLVNDPCEPAPAQAPLRCPAWT